MKKKRRFLLCAAAALLCVFLLCRSRVIGTVRGAEWEKIIIDDVTYVENSRLNFSSGDKGRFLGFATNGDVTFFVFSVKGDTERQYLYRLWGYDGAFYERQD